MTMLDLAVLATQEIDPKGNQSIGWLAGLYTLGLFIVIGLLLWSFTKMARKAREPWEGEDTDARRPEDDPPAP
ncbi:MULTISPECIES: hypothetical protein [Aeromicrobium]|uniref:Uncharacterized protein n=1 Tax=Aeromicrobium phoceense TaxID=2754045 RepID=A0A838XMK9_9ACTN|nr:MULTISPECIES: hypothetical protein [Aeromicrobium]MBA4608183.1 hypothetical protein [Aeromicrobium phoceense]